MSISSLLIALAIPIAFITANANEPLAVTEQVPTLIPSQAQTVSVTYTANFDFIEGLAEIACKTGLCDCEAVYQGTGTLHASKDHTYTFLGTFTQTAGKCNEGITFWSPEDGKSYHTLHFNEDESALTDWVAHKKTADKRPFSVEEGIKENGQCFISEMNAVLGADGSITHTESDTSMIGPFKVTSSHTVKITLAP
jgi:hypothetical protein